MELKETGVEMENIMEAWPKPMPVDVKPFIEASFIVWLQHHIDIAHHGDIVDSQERTAMDYAVHFELRSVAAYLYHEQYFTPGQKHEADIKFLDMGQLHIKNHGGHIKNHGGDGDMMDTETKYEGGIAEFRSLLVNYISNAIIDNGCLAKFNQ
jgi:hypothetical protein